MARSDDAKPWPDDAIEAFRGAIDYPYANGEETNRVRRWLATIDALRSRLSEVEGERDRERAANDKWHRDVEELSAAYFAAQGRADTLATQLAALAAASRTLVAAALTAAVRLDYVDAEDPGEIRDDLERAALAVPFATSPTSTLEITERVRREEREALLERVIRDGAAIDANAESFARWWASEVRARPGMPRSSRTTQEGETPEKNKP